ncbi:MAG: hypothetical protein COC05_05590 [Gammaproteobacteria bacterium]|nr:MAG: hypothetical protein COC05_05590 [Gammaproteobacteria bacterium]
MKFTADMKWYYTPVLPVILILLMFFQPAVAATLEVKVDGVSGAQLKNVLAHLAINTEKGRQDLLSSRIHRLHERAPEQIKTALQPFGYYRVEISSKLQQTDDKWEAYYKVDRGDPLRIKALDFQISGAGKDDVSFQALQKSFLIDVGQILVHSRYERAKQGLQRLAATRGYLDARFSQHEAKVDLQAYTAAVILHFDTGVRFSFGPVSFEQKPDTFDETLLNRYITIKLGEPYSTSALQTIRAGLADSNYFSEVEIIPLRNQAKNNQIPVQIILTPGKRSKTRFGVGFGTDTGPRVTAEHTRRVNRRGHKININTRLSPRISSAGLQYIVPLENPVSEQLAFVSNLSDENTESRKSTITNIGLRHTSLRGSWQETKSLTYESEKFIVGEENQTSALLLPGISWNRTKADDRLFPQHGHRLRLDLLGSANAIGSDVDFVQSRLSWKAIYSAGQKNRFLIRGDAGASWVGDLQELPASKRFFAGGDQSVRGYDLEELGPVDDAGDVIGGRHLLVGSAEYERQLFNKWSAAVFYDAGNALNSFSEKLNHGAGFGVRWRSPIGPVRLDFAWGLSDPGQPIRLHFTVGPDL